MLRSCQPRLLLRLPAARQPHLPAVQRRWCTDEIPGLRRTAFRAHLKRLKKPEGDAAEPDIAGPLARCSTAVVRPHGVEALVADYSSKISGLYRGVPGFEGALLLLSRGSTNRAKSISLWRAKADFEAAAETAPYRSTMAALGSHFLAAPELEVWEHAGCTVLRPVVLLSARAERRRAVCDRSFFAERPDAPSDAEGIRVLQQRVAALKEQARHARPARVPRGPRAAHAAHSLPRAARTHALDPSTTCRWRASRRRTRLAGRATRRPCCAQR